MYAIQSTQLDQHRDSYRGYVGMLVVDKPYRKLKLGSELVSRALAVMVGFTS
jgi:peptide alpha-N-acetyltransferase